MFLGIDLGTSGLKALLVDAAQNTVAHTTIPLAVANPAPGHSEQDPAAWWDAFAEAMRRLRAEAPRQVAAVQAVGISGQMHGAVLLDKRGKVLRPCILWNDVRATRECEQLRALVPDMEQIAGNLAMPGFTAPKLLWVRAHEPEIFAQVAHVLLPKAWLGYCLTGEMVEEMSDASGTLWLDVGKRDWSEKLLAACDLSRANMPRLVEGSDKAGIVRNEIAGQLGLPNNILVAGGAGDNAAGAVGLGAVVPGTSFLSLGTSGVLWATTANYRPYPQSAVHTFCHALPGIWHQMGVTLSAGASLAWWARVSGKPESELLQEIADPHAPSPAIFLPYLSGERTPHNDGTIRGAFADLAQDTNRAAMTQAVLEGVAFSFRDCLDALTASGTVITEADVIGGGARSALWVRILASVLNIPLYRLQDGEHGGAFGAARLARMALTNEAPSSVCGRPERLAPIMPDTGLNAAYAEKLVRYRTLYAGVRPASPVL